MLIVSNISKKYGLTEALRDVSLSIQLGELTVVLGPSGGGKTTLLRCISLLDSPDTGSVEVDGIIFRFPDAGSREDLYPKISVVFQNLALWPHLTLRENILLPLSLSGRGSNREYVAQLIEAFEMGGFVDRFPRQASGGERQRAALVRALALRPTYLLLDEITSALDVEQVSIVLRELERLKQEGVGILLVTHLVGFARRAAEKFVFLSEGRALESGDIECLKRPQHRRLKTFLEHVLGAS